MVFFGFLHCLGVFYVLCVSGVFFVVFLLVRVFYFSDSLKHFSESYPTFEVSKTEAALVEVLLGTSLKATLVMDYT